ncbi:MAG: hypothetical protein ACI4XB_07745, partial [Ruminococcus sp.]
SKFYSDPLKFDFFIRKRGAAKGMQFFSKKPLTSRGKCGKIIRPLVSGFQDMEAELLFSGARSSEFL